MKKYKVIKEYPGSPKIDEILSLHEDKHFYTSDVSMEFLPVHMVEKFPEFFELVVDEKEKEVDLLLFVYPTSLDKNIEKLEITSDTEGWIELRFHYKDKMPAIYKFSSLSMLDETIFGTDSYF